MNLTEIVYHLLEVKKTRNVPLQQVENQIFNWLKKIAPDLPKKSLANELHIHDREERGYISINMKVLKATIPKLFKDYNAFINAFEKNALKGTNWTVSETTRFGMFTRFQKAVSITIERYARTYKKPKYLYHATFADNEAKINRQGLKPRKRVNDPDYRYSNQRIFFARSKKASLQALSNDYGKKDVVVYRLNTQKFNRFNLFIDRTETGAYYTLTHIPAKYLEIIYRGQTPEFGT